MSYFGVITAAGFGLHCVGFSFPSAYHHSPFFLILWESIMIPLTSRNPEEPLNAIPFKCNCSSCFFKSMYTDPKHNTTAYLAEKNTGETPTLKGCGFPTVQMPPVGRTASVKGIGAA